MFSKSFVAIAMLSFAFTATAFGQKEIVVWQSAKGAKNVKRTPQQPKTGSLIDTSTGEIVWADEAKASNPNLPNQRTVNKPKTGSLIDTSTGEIVWAKGSKSHSSNARQTPGATPKGISFNFDKMSQVQRKGQPKNFSAGQDSRMDSRRTKQARRPQKQ
ncbi:MAG: hypothetical protein JNM09_16135 [Blastocatellia bacterium]|nr:hypothetical protein [Blastocatellia bacterium]